MDKRAFKILADTYWSPAGWKQNGRQGLNGDDFAYAKSKRMMFDPVVLDHSDAIAKLTQLIARTTRRQVVDAFLASLSSRRLDWRSALGSYAVFQRLEPHESLEGDLRCRCCGLYLNEIEPDLNMFSFARHKWGGVTHDHVNYAILDLELFLEGAAPKPTQEDFEIFRNLIGRIAAVPASTTSAALHSHFASVLKSNKSERDVIIQILGYCGILGTSEHPGYTDEFIEVRERNLPDRHFVDMSYPACWWSGKVGVDRSKLNAYFAHALDAAT